MARNSCLSRGNWDQRRGPFHQRCAATCSDRFPRGTQQKSLHMPAVILPPARGGAANLVRILHPGSCFCQVVFRVEMPCRNARAQAVAGIYQMLITARERLSARNGARAAGAGTIFVCILPQIPTSGSAASRSAQMRRGCPQRIMHGWWRNSFPRLLEGPPMVGVLDGIAPDTGILQRAQFQLPICAFNRPTGGIRFDAAQL